MFVGKDENKLKRGQGLAIFLLFNAGRSDLLPR